MAQGLQGLISNLEAGAVELRAVEAHFDYSYSNWWLKKIIDIDPILRGFSSTDHERKIREFRQADEKFQKLTEKYIAATLSGRIPTATGAMVGADSELGRLRRELQKQRKHMPVRQLVQGLPTLLPKLKPIKQDAAVLFVSFFKTWVAAYTARLRAHASFCKRLLK